VEVVVIIAPIIAAVISAPLVTPVVVAVILLVRTRSSPDILLDLLVGLIRICSLFRHHEQVLDRFRPFTEQLSSESVMIVEAPDKHEDGLIIVDVGDGYPCLREATNVVTHRLIWIVFDFLQIVFVAGLLTSGHVVIDKSLSELSPGVDGAFLQAKEPLVCRLIDDHRQVVGHNIFVASRYSDSDLVQYYPRLGVGLSVICIQVMELEVFRPDNSTESVSERSET
jgi:hypothetical protein